jgi:hypothetical protein
LKVYATTIRPVQKKNWLVCLKRLDQVKNCTKQTGLLAGRLPFTIAYSISGKKGLGIPLPNIWSMQRN